MHNMHGAHTRNHRGRDYLVASERGRESVRGGFAQGLRSQG
jgi:hypothetical protein